jgi:hypothetical protein
MYSMVLSRTTVYSNRITIIVFSILDLGSVSGHDHRISNSPRFGDVKLWSRVPYQQLMVIQVVKIFCLL